MSGHEGGAPRPPGFPETPDPVAHWAEHAPARTALVDRRTGARLSYRDLDALATRWHALLLELGVRPGDLVGVLAPNRLDVVALFLGCGRVGAALVPYNWRLAAAELAAIVEDSVPNIVFHDDVFRSAAEQAARAVPGSVWLDLDRDVPARLDAAANPAGAILSADPEAAALVLYTSGSTGRPKGAVLPHRQLFYNAVATCVSWELGPADVAPVSTPLFHTGGWNVFATPLWHRGGTVVLMEEFEPAAYLHALAEEGCTVALTVPTQLLMMQESDAWGLDLPALRYFISGGAPCPPAVGARVRGAGYRFKEGYGLTECGPNCFAISVEEAERKPGAVGRPVAFLETRRVDDRGDDVSPGEEGELILRGPQLFAGYLRAPDRTADAFTPDGWLRTGDIAGADADGAHTICGRRKEMFISGGENVFPAEVEAVLAAAPGVAEVVVVGVPDPKWGEVGRAFVVLRPGAAGGAEALASFARERLAGYKVPKGFVAVAEIPRLGSGKPDRAALVRIVD